MKGMIITTDVEKNEFIKKIAAHAVKNMSGQGLAASVTIAQAILESGWGRSELAREANALFGIKAGSGWPGKIYTIWTEECRDGKTFTREIASFRAYDSWSDSIADHCKLLTQASRYRGVIGNTDCASACAELQKAGYATDPQYAKKLIQIIDYYNLQAYDTSQNDAGQSAAKEQKAVPDPQKEAKEQKVILDGKPYDVKAFNESGQIYVTVPIFSGLNVKLRDLLALSGYDVSWDDRAKTVIAVKI